MTILRRPIIAGNWKMNGLRVDSLPRVGELSKRLSDILEPRFDLLICPPSTILETVATVIKNSGIYLGGQDCHSAPSGPHTGDISAEMLADIGCSHVILGHSERRSDHKETNDVVRSKASTALASNLITIICIGETLKQRDAGNTNNVIIEQLFASMPSHASFTNTVIAYEPVWAIGSGVSATVDMISNAHKDIRNILFNNGFNGNKTSILYG